MFTRTIPTSGFNPGLKRAQSHYFSPSFFPLFFQNKDFLIITLVQFLAHSGLLLTVRIWLKAGTLQVHAALINLRIFSLKVAVAVGGSAAVAVLPYLSSLLSLSDSCPPHEASSWESCTFPGRLCYVRIWERDGTWVGSHQHNNMCARHRAGRRGPVEPTAAGRELSLPFPFNYGQLKLLRWELWTLLSTAPIRRRTCLLSNNLLSSHLKKLGLLSSSCRVITRTQLLFLFQHSKPFVWEIFYLVSHLFFSSLQLVYFRFLVAEHSTVSHHFVWWYTVESRMPWRRAIFYKTSKKLQTHLNNKKLDSPLHH